jgi:hypothetical protein
MIQLLAGVAILVSLLLPWAEVAFSWFNTGSTSASSTFVEMATSSDGLAQMWLDLVLLGVAVALFASLMSLSMRDAARSASAIALVGFGLAVLGSAYFLAEGMNWDYSILSPGNGAYLCLLAAVVGGLAAVARLANPRLGTPAAAVAGYWGGGPYRSAPPWAAPPWAAPQPWAAASPWGAPPGPTYPGAPQPPPWPGGQYPPPYPPSHGWPPQPLAQTDQAPTYAVPPNAPVGSAAQLVVLEAGRSRMLSVQPGEQLLVGRDADAQVRLADPSVQPRHATIERRGSSWVVRDLQTANPSRLMDATGSIRYVGDETTAEAGQLLIGNVLLTLYRG